MKKSGFWYSLIVFSLLVIFFIVLHPIAIFDTDDWNFVDLHRVPIPLPFYWNPIKVFPEFFMSFISGIGAYTIYPLIGNYCYAMSVSNGLFICFIMTVYFTEFYLLIRKKFDLTTLKAVMIGIIFIAIHFCAIAEKSSDNVFFFYSYDMSCVYHYILSTLLNASLVMHLMRLGGFEGWGTLSKLHRVLLILWTYLAMFSSLYSNVVLAAYVGVELLMALINELREKSFQLKTYCKANKPKLIILVIWLVAFVIERTGGRASYHDTGLFHNILLTGKMTISWLGRFNVLFIVFALGVVFARIFLIRKDNFVRDIKCFLALALTTLYIILLSAFVAYAYVWRTDAFLPVLFYGTFMLMMFVCELAERVSFSGSVLVLIAAVSVAGTVYFSDTYKEMNYENLPYENCVALVDDIIAQFKEAESRGDTKTDLVLPAFDTEDNWPIADYAGYYFTRTMYDHKVTGSYIEVGEMIFTKEKNEEFGIK